MSIDSDKLKAHPIPRRSGESGDSIRKRLPLEQAIAVKTDRRARYDASMREKGFKRTTIWVREERLESLQALVHCINTGEGDLAEAVEAFCKVAEA